MDSNARLNLVINPGSTSTKIGIFRGDKKIVDKTLRHTQDELKNFTDVYAEREFRTQVVINMLKDLGYNVSDFAGVVAIAGRIKPGLAGIYEVNEQMIDDLKMAKYKEHASNLGALIANDIALLNNTRAYVADAVTVDEMAEVARFSGMPELERHGATHTVNQKCMARKAAKELGIPYEKAKLVVCHLGGGISVVAHKQGLMVDGNVPMGEGPFCIDRTGSLNCFEVVQLCYSGKYTKEEMSRKIRGDGGISAYLHTRNFKEVCDMKEAGNDMARKVFDAMAYQVAKEIGSASVAVGGNPDAIVLTGGMANSVELVEEISRQVSFLGNVIVYPGEEELESLNDHLLQVQKKEVEPMVYGG